MMKPTMCAAARIPPRPDRHPLALVLACLLAAAGCGAEEQKQDEDKVIPRAPAATRAAEVEGTTAPSTAEPARAPAHLDRASLRVLGMT